MLCCAVLRCVVLCRVVLCCVVLCCAVLFCGVPCCAMLCVVPCCCCWRGEGGGGGGPSCTLRPKLGRGRPRSLTLRPLVILDVLVRGVRAGARGFYLADCLLGLGVPRGVEGPGPGTHPRTGGYAALPRRPGWLLMMVLRGWAQAHIPQGAQAAMPRYPGVGWSFPFLVMYHRRSHVHCR